MMTSAIYVSMQILAAYIVLSLTSGEHNTVCPEGCSCLVQDLELRCRGQILSSAPTVPDAQLLETLDLSNNNIMFLQPDFFDGYEKLDTVILSNAMIQKIDPGVFHSLKNLKAVDLSHNSFSAVPPELFTQNPKLQNVSLSDNPLTMQPLDLPILNSSSLTSLNLRNCKLSNLSTTSLSQVPNVRYLDLSYNRFKVLSADTLVPLSRLNYIDLRNKHWICCADFEILICFAYDKSNSHPHIMKCLTTRRSKVYTAHAQCKLCTNLSNCSTSFTNISSTPTALNGVEIGKETLGIVTDFPNKTAQSEFSSNKSSTSSTDSTIEKTTTARTGQHSQNSSPKEHRENVNEKTKGLGEDIASDETTKPLEKYDGEEPNESGKKTETNEYFIWIGLSVFVVLLIVCGGIWYFKRENLPLARKKILYLLSFLWLRDLLRISSRVEQNPPNCEPLLVSNVNERRT